MDAVLVSAVALALLVLWFATLGRALREVRSDVVYPGTPTSQMCRVARSTTSGSPSSRRFASS